MSICRLYVRWLRRECIADESDTNSPQEIGEPVAGADDEIANISRSDVSASAQKIVQTYLRPDSEREIVLPGPVVSQIILELDENGRDDPEIFDVAKDWVYQAMERDAFPGFLHLSRPGLRIFRKSILGPLLMNMTFRGRSKFDPRSM